MAKTATSTESSVKENIYPYYLPGKIPDNLVERFLEAFATVLQFTDYRQLLDTYCATSAKCNRCSVACPVYLASGDPRDIPCYRTNLLLEVYKRYFTISGWFKSRLSSRFDLTEEIVNEMAVAFYRCTACRRCTMECPLGIEHSLLTRLGRYILSLIGISSKALQVSVDEQLEGETHNTSKIPKVALLDTLEFLTEELEESFGIKMEYPVDQYDREFVFFAAVSDYLMEPETLMGNAAVIYAAGDWDKWTIGTGNYDGINYGLFYSDWYLENIVKQLVSEVDRLRGKKILIGECGHASRSAHDFVPIFLKQDAYPVINCMEYALDCLEKGKIKLNSDIITERVTYHDPCNIARSGWIVDQPRKILKSFVKDFVEMEPHGINNYCCGGGGGLVSIDEIHDFRMDIGGKVKAEQIRQTGAEILISPCANCKKQLKELVEHYELPCKVMGLHDLILKAIEIPGGKSPQERKEEAALYEM
ncbi:MAG: (Fe-S)-binding protein [Candidatus Hatepunaea meridiana]|nr:(Fe-S)-binding protein [Candidatus Hatepunaea meridiana]